MYFAIHTPDTARAKDFYNAVFGWTYDSSGDYHHIKGSSPAGGITPATPPASALYVRGAGHRGDGRQGSRTGRYGTGSRRSKSGWSVQIADGHGGGVELWQPAEGYAADGDPKGEGDVFYFVVPSRTTRRSRSTPAVLGWELIPGKSPGRVEHQNVMPPGGMFVSARRARLTCTSGWPMSTTAAELIREAGGTAGEKQPNSPRPPRGVPRRPGNGVQHRFSKRQA